MNDCRNNMRNALYGLWQVQAGFATRAVPGSTNQMWMVNAGPCVAQGVAVPPVQPGPGEDVDLANEPPHPDQTLLPPNGNWGEPPWYLHDRVVVVDHDNQGFVIHIQEYGIERPGLLPFPEGAYEHVHEGDGLDDLEFVIG